MKQEQEREQAEIRSKMLSPEAKALAMKDLQDVGVQRFLRDRSTS